MRINNKQPYQHLGRSVRFFIRDLFGEEFHLADCLPGAGRHYVGVFEVGGGGLGVHQHGGRQVTGLSVIEFFAIDTKRFCFCSDTMKLILSLTKT